MSPVVTHVTTRAVPHVTFVTTGDDSDVTASAQVMSTADAMGDVCDVIPARSSPGRHRPQRPPETRGRGMPKPPPAGAALPAPAHVPATGAARGGQAP